MSDGTMSTSPATLGRLQRLAARMSSAHDAPPSVLRLLDDAGLEAVSFSQRSLTILSILTDTPDPQERDHLMALAASVAGRHHGSIDYFHGDGSLVFFETPERCLPMAMDLQATARERRLRMGVHAGVWEVAVLHGRDGAEAGCTLIGEATAEAVRAARMAAAGSIVISSQAYALVQHDIRLYSRSCILTEEYEDSGFATASLTPAPSRGGPELSTFAGLSFN